MSRLRTFWARDRRISLIKIVLVSIYRVDRRSVVFIEERFHVFETSLARFGVQEPWMKLARVMERRALERDGAQIMIAETRFVLMKMKCVFEPMLFMPTGQVCEEMMAPMEEPEAAMFKPRARKFVGKIWNTIRKESLQTHEDRPQTRTPMLLGRSQWSTQRYR